MTTCPASSTTRSERPAPMPGASPAVAHVNLLWLLRQPFVTWHLALQRLAKEHGPRVRLRQWPIHDVHYVGTPAGIEEVLVTKATSFHKGRGTRRLERILGRGILTAEQPEHLPHRRLVQPAFHRKRLEQYGEVMADRSRAQVASWVPGATIDVEHEMNRLAFEIVAQTLFGVDLERDMRTVGRGLDDAMNSFPMLMAPYSETLDRVDVLPHNRKLNGAVAKLNGVVDRLIAEHGDADRGDVLSMLLAARDEDGRAMTPVEVRDEALTILLAGHETTANALAWTFFALQRSPDVERALHRHLDEVLGDRDPEFADVPRLDYVRAVLSETMRLWPPAWMTSRVALTDVVIDGAPVKAGDEVLVSQYVLHRDPQYFPEPARFDPTRFIGEHDRPKFAYFPFGGGTRLCIGESFAMTESILALATIARRVRLAAIDDAEVRMLPLVTLRPRDAIRARVLLRSEPATGDAPPGVASGSNAPEPVLAMEATSPALMA